LGSQFSHYVISSYPVYVKELILYTQQNYIVPKGN